MHHAVYVAARLQGPMHVRFSHGNFMYCVINLATSYRPSIAAMYFISPEDTIIIY